MLKGAIVLGRAAADAIYGDDGVNEIEQRIQLVSPSRVIEPASWKKDPPEWLNSVEVLFTGWEAPTLDDRLLTAMPQLQAVFYGAGSVRGIVTDAFWARNIILSTAAAANAVPVSEYTVATVLLSLKGMWQYVARQHRGEEFPGPPVCMPGAYGSMVGLVALGEIGRLVLKRLQLFDVVVRVNDPYLTENFAQELKVETMALDEMFARCDVVSIHAPLLPSTVGLITGRHVRSMKPGATLINTARGGLLREDEVYAALRDRTDVTAVLDVVAQEPIRIGDRLLSLPNVIITPHIAGSQGVECRRMGQFAIAEYDRWRAGTVLQGQISPADFAQRA